MSLSQALDRSDLDRNMLAEVLLFKGKKQERLFQLARKKRSEYFPLNEVEIRSVIELSNSCQQNCNFCNINFNTKKKNFLIKYDKFINILEQLYYRNRKVILIQSGENRTQSYIDFVCKCISDIKNKFTDLTIILCLGNLSYKQYRQLRESGGDRYILKFETSNSVLYKQMKPNESLQARLECIEMLNKLGFVVGSGNIIGLPNQTIKDIVNDLLFISRLKLTMTSTSVFIPGEESNYWNEPIGDLDITLNYMALMRIIYPHMLIPSTSSLEKAKKGGQYLGLMAGANTITIHDGTPTELKKHFPIYSVRRFTPDEMYIRNIVAMAGLSFK